MDPQEVLKLINNARAAINLEPLTMEQYNAAVNADTKEGRRHRAAREAGRRHQVRKELQRKYSLPKDNLVHPFARCFGNFLREEKTERDVQYNQKMMEKLSTPEGTTEVLDDLIKQITNLPDSVYFPKDEAEMISNYENYGALMDTMFNMENVMTNMTLNEMSYSSGVKDFIKNHHGVFNLCGMQLSMVNEWASPFYPGIGDPTLETMGAVIMASGSADKSPEADAFKDYGSRLQADVMFPDEKPVLEGGRKLVDAGFELKYADENIYDAAKRAAGDNGYVNIKTLNDGLRRSLNRQLSQKVAMTKEEREIKFNKNTPESPDMVKEEIEEIGELKKGMEAAKSNVFFGSKEFDRVADDLANLQKANSMLLDGNPGELSSKQVAAMKKAYAALEKDCKAYLERKQKQGQLNVDPKSKTGKRIEMVRKALKYGQLAGYRFEAREQQIKNELEQPKLRAEAESLKAQADKLLYDSLTPESAGQLIKNMNEAARTNSDKDYGQRITDQLFVAAKYMRDNNLKPADCKLTNEDYNKMSDAMRSKGVGKKPEPFKAAGKTKSNEKKNDRPTKTTGKS